MSVDIYVCFNAYIHVRACMLVAIGSDQWVNVDMLLSLYVST